MLKSLGVTSKTRRNNRHIRNLRECHLTHWVRLDTEIILIILGKNADEASQANVFGERQTEKNDAFTKLQGGAKQLKMMKDLMASTMAEYKKQVTCTILSEQLELPEDLANLGPDRLLNYYHNPEGTFEIEPYQI